MKLHEINAEQFNELAFAEPDSSICQTSYYADHMVSQGYTAFFLQADDDRGICEALSLILLKKGSFLSGKYNAFAPYGFLINYYDDALFREFHSLLIPYLREKKVSRLLIEPQVPANDPTVIKLLTELGYQKEEDFVIYEENAAQHENFLADSNIILKFGVSKDDSILSTLLTKKQDLEKLQLFDHLKGHVLSYYARLDTSKSLRAIEESLSSANRFVKEYASDYKYVEEVGEKENEIKRLNALSNLIRGMEEDPYVAAICVSDFSDKCTILFTAGLDEGDPFCAEEQIIDQICAECKNRGIISIGSDIPFASAKEKTYLGRFLYKL